MIGNVFKECIKCKFSFKVSLEKNIQFDCPKCHIKYEYRNDTLIIQNVYNGPSTILESYHESFEGISISIKRYKSLFYISHSISTDFLNELPGYSPGFIESKFATRKLLDLIYNDKPDKLCLFNSHDELISKLKLHQIDTTKIDKYDFYNTVLYEIDNIKSIQEVRKYFIIRNQALSNSFYNYDDYYSELPVKFSYGVHALWNDFTNCSFKNCSCHGDIIYKPFGYMFIKSIDYGYKEDFTGQIVCEKAAIINNLNLESARKDMILWWKYHKIPQRNSIENGIQLKTIKQRYSFIWPKRIEPKHMVSQCNVLFVDIETNGLPININAPLTRPENWPFIIQIAWRLYSENGSLIINKAFLIKPINFSIGKESIKFHGITKERAEKEGVLCKDALIEFNKALNDTIYIIGHNVEFDSKIIQAEMIRNNISNVMASKKHFCTMQNAKSFCNIRNSYGLKNPNLQELYFKTFNRSFSGAHSAEADILATADCFWKLKQQNIYKLPK